MAVADRIQKRKTILILLEIDSAVCQHHSLSVVTFFCSFVCFSFISLCRFLHRFDSVSELRTIHVTYRVACLRASDCDAIDCSLLVENVCRLLR